MKYKCKYNSPLGKITMLSDGDYLTNLWIKGQPEVFGEFKEKEDLKIKKKKKKWLDEYFQGKEPKVEVPIKFEGTEFRKEVWNILLEIPYGKTTTYGEIAKKIAEKKQIKTMSAQAIGGAVGHNPISIIVPCHRVLGTDGRLTGYAGGISLKVALLNIEKIQVE